MAERRSSGWSEPTKARAGAPPWQAAGPALARGAGLWSDAAQEQLAQWQRSLDKLGSGRYGPLDAARDAQDSLQRAVGLCAGLAGLLWQGWLGAGGGTSERADRRQGLQTRQSPPAEARTHGSAAAAGATPASTPPSSTTVTRPPAPADAPVAAAQPGARSRAAARPRRRPTSRAPTQAPRQAPRRPPDPSRERRPTALEAAERFLRRQLAGGERPAQELLKEAAAAGHSETTLRRAKKLIGAKHRRAGFGGDSKVFWALPAG